MLPTGQASPELGQLWVYCGAAGSKTPARMGKGFAAEALFLKKSRSGRNGVQVVGGMFRNLSQKRWKRRATKYNYLIK